MIISYKKLIILVCTVSIVHGLHTELPALTNSGSIQLTENGDHALTFDNEEKMLLITDMKNGCHVAVPLPSLPGKGSALTLNYRRNLAACGYFKSSTVDVVDLEKLSASEKLMLEGDTPSYIENISWSQDGNLLAVCPSQGNTPFTIFDRRSGKSMYKRIEGEYMYSATMHPLKMHALMGYLTSSAYAESKSLVKVFDVDADRLFKEIETSHKTVDTIDTMHSAFSPNAKFIAVSGSKGFALLGSEDYEKVAYHDVTSFSTTAVFNDSSTYCALGHERGIDIVNVPEFDCIERKTQSSGIVFQLDWQGPILAASTSGINQILFWDMDNYNK